MTKISNKFPEAMIFYKANKGRIEDQGSLVT